MTTFNVLVTREDVFMFETVMEIEAEDIEEAKLLAEDLAEELDDEVWEEKDSYSEFNACTASYSDSND